MLASVLLTKLSCRLGYCNSLLYGFSNGRIRKLQSMQNAVARLITGARRCDYITHVLRQLHTSWLATNEVQTCLLIAAVVVWSETGFSLVADSGRRLLWSSVDRTLSRPTITYHICRQEHTNSDSRHYTTFEVIQGHPYTVQQIMITYVLSRIFQVIVLYWPNFLFQQWGTPFYSSYFR